VLATFRRSSTPEFMDAVPSNRGCAAAPEAPTVCLVRGGASFAAQPGRPSGPGRVRVTPPLVSIVTPSFNQGRFLEETIRSVLDQDYEPIEYIVIDGGSTDASIDIIERYADRLARWTTGPNTGQAAAINEGLRRATGDVMGFLNSDDTLLPGAVAAMVAELRHNPSLLLVYGDALYTDERSRRTGSLPARPFDIDAMVRGCDNHVVQPSTLWRRQAWERFGPFDENAWYFFDFQFFLQFPADRVSHIGRPLSTYRVHPHAKSTGADGTRLARDHERLAESFFTDQRLPEALRPAAREGRAQAYLLGAEFAYEGLDLSRTRRYVLRAFRLAPQRVLAGRWLSLLAKSSLPTSLVRRLRTRRRAS
jgi:glycosyltransferase involved in cell wall biosynthesis